MDKRKIVLISVSTVCLLVAGIIMAIHFGLFDKAPDSTVVVNPVEEMMKDPEMKKAIEQSIKIEEDNRAKNRTAPAGS